MPADDKTTHRLKNLRLTRIALVDQGANPFADVMLLKRDDVGDPLAYLCEPLAKVEELEAASFDEALAETEGRMKAWEIMDQVHPLMDALHQSVRSIFEAETGDSRKSKLRESVGQFLKEVKARLSEIGKSKIAPAELATLKQTVLSRKGGEPMTTEEKAQFDKLTKSVEALTAKVEAQATTEEELRKRLAGVKPEVAPDESPVQAHQLQKLDADTQQAVDKIADENSTLRKELKKVQQERAVDVEAIRITKAYPNLNDDPRKWAEMMLKFEPDSEDRKTIEKMLETNNANVTDLIKATGTDRRNENQDGEAFTQLQRKAQEIQKSGKPMTEAWDMACEQNPQLAAQYREER
jgi:hypothetical protein